jgi:AAHS family 4-hydroxybenzoate transporter-like MFS transporter
MGIGGTSGTVVETDSLLDGAKTSSFHFIIGLLCALIMLFDGYSIAVMGYIAPLIIADLHISKAALGSIISANLAGNMVGLLFSSALTLRIGPRRMAILSIGVFGAAEILAALSHNHLGLLIFRFISGAGCSTAMLCAVLLIGEFFPKRWRSSAVTYVYLGYTLGEMASGGATSFLVKQHHGWQSPMILGGSLALTLALFLIFVLPDSPEYLLNREKRPDKARAVISRVCGSPIPENTILAVKDKGAKSGSVGELLKGNRAAPTLLLWFAAAMTGMLAAFIHNWFTTILVVSGMSHAEAVSVTIIVTASGIAAGFTVGPLMDKVGPFVGLIGLMVGGAVAATALAFVTNRGAFATVTFIAFALGYCSSGIGKGWNAMGVFLYPISLRPTGLGWMIGLGRVGAIIGPMIVGFLVQSGLSPAMVFQSIAAPMLLAATAAYAARKLYKGSASPDGGRGETILDSNPAPKAEAP